MTRSEAIAVINAKLAILDDDEVLAVAGIVDTIDLSEPSSRTLSSRERALIKQSQADFATGKSYSHEQLVAKLDERLAQRGVPISAG